MSATCKEKIQHDKTASSLVKLGLHLVMQFFLNRKQKRGRRPESAINCSPGNAKRLECSGQQLLLKVKVLWHFHKVPKTATTVSIHHNFHCLERDSQTLEERN
jgi:hypothetical protein